MKKLLAVIAFALVVPAVALAGHSEAKASDKSAKKTPAPKADSADAGTAAPKK